MTGDWDAAGAELAQAADADGLAGIEFLACYRAWLAALRGEAPAAQAILAGLGDLRASEDPQDQASIAVAEAFTAAARGQPAAALRHARDCPGPRRRPGDQPRGPAVGLAAGRPRRARPGRHRRHPRPARPARRLPARAAGPHAARRTRPGPRPPGRRQRRPGPPARRSPPRSAGLRQHCHPLPPGPWPARPCPVPPPPGRDRGRRRPRSARPAGIATRLHCQPLLDRAADLLPEEPPIRAPMMTAPGPEESAAVRDG